MKITDIIRNFTDKLGRAPRIGFVGVGKSSLSLINKIPDTPVSLRSEREICAELPQSASYYDIRVGDSYLDGIYEDMLFLSPSVRRDKRQLIDAMMGGTMLLSDAELFFSDCDIPVYAVSGSDGKSTTSTLAAMLLGEKYPSADAVGNIGKAFADIGSAECAVAELSSFQLSYLHPAVKAALITGITPNHLNWHASFEEYSDAKLGLLTFAERKIISPDTERTRTAAVQSRHSAVYSILYSEAELREAYPADEYFCLKDGYIVRNGEALLPIAECRRSERHNVHNLMGAMALTWGEYSAEHLLSVARGFGGLEHRCERFHTWCGIEFINSSIDTTPSRTAATLSSLARSVHIILGGRSKGVPISECIPYLERYAKSISLYGEAGKEYLDELGGAGLTERIGCKIAERFDDAVDNALLNAKFGDTVLLSPAATGYGEFASFAERGRHFKNYIKNKYPRTSGA